MKMPAFIPTIGRLPVHWLLEGLLIVIGVVLGFWVTQIQEARQNREHAARADDSSRGERRTLTGSDETDRPP